MDSSICKAMSSYFDQSGCSLKPPTKEEHSYDPCPADFFLLLTFVISSEVDGSVDEIEQEDGAEQSNVMSSYCAQYIPSGYILCTVG